MRKLILGIFLAAVVVAALGAMPASSDSVTNAKHFFWARQQSTPTPDQLTNNIIYHGGNVGPGAIGVLRKPSLYLVYWGAEWRKGFKIADTDGKQFQSTTLQNYLNTMGAGLGGSRWMGVATQYCSGIAAGSTTCKGDKAAKYIQNPTGQLKGVWTDGSAVPDAILAYGLAQNLADDPIAAEAVRAAQHFNTWDPNAVYVIMVPPRPVATGQPAYCGYHTQTTSVNGLGNPARIQYSFIPWQNTDWPGLGQGCGLHVVNKKSDSFGHGIFDSWSIVVGHEYSEAVTDPDNVTSVQDGWNDDQTSENADKCAWTELANITLGDHAFAMQPTWSNEAFDAGRDGCAMRRY
jgi:serine protease